MDDIHVERYTRLVEWFASRYRICQYNRNNLIAFQIWSLSHLEHEQCLTNAVAVSREANVLEKQAKKTKCERVSPFWAERRALTALFRRFLEKYGNK